MRVLQAYLQNFIILHIFCYFTTSLLNTLSKWCVKMQVMLVLRKMPFHYTSVCSELERMCSISKTVRIQNTRHGC